MLKTKYIYNIITLRSSVVEKNETRELIARNRVLASKSFRIAVVN